MLQQLGRERHPERPYSDPRVTAHVDDGRAFLERTDRRYDLILLALPDSRHHRHRAVRAPAGELPVHRPGAGRRPGRCSSRAARFAMYNYYEPWLVDRYANTLERRLRHRALRPGGTVARPAAGGRAQPSARTAGWPAAPRSGSRPRRPWSRPPTTGRSRTWPSATIPTFYLWMLGLILVASLLLVRVGGRSAADDAAVRGPVLHGRGVPAAGDEERGAVRAAVRHHLVR